MTLSLKSAVGVLLAVTTVVSLAEEQDLGTRIREAENEKRKIERELWDCKRRVSAGEEAAGARQYLWNVERVLRDAESRQKELRTLADRNRALAKQLGDRITQELAKNSDYVEAEKARGRIMSEITALEHEKALNRTKLSDRNSPIQAALNRDQTLSDMRSELYARGASRDEWKPYNEARAEKLKTIPGAAQLMKQQEEIDKKVAAKRKDADELSKKVGSIRAPIESAKEGPIAQLKTKVAEARNAYNARKKELVEAKANPAAPDSSSIFTLTAIS